MLDRLTFVRSLELPEDAGKALHHNRLSRLAREGAKTTPQHLRRFDPLRRRATLIAYLSERAADLSDLALEMHDRMIGALMNRAEKMRDEGFRKHGKAINEKVGLYARLGKALIDARETGEDPYDVLEEMMGWERFVASVAEAEGLASRRTSTTWTSWRPATPTSAATPRPSRRPSTSGPPRPPSP